MNRNLVLIALSLAMVAFQGAADAAPKKVALLIGNEKYDSRIGGRLKNPLNDVALVGKALQKDDFDVTVVPNATRKDILREIRKLATKLRDEGADATGIFYYSGHGFARPDDRVNFIIPVDLPQLTTQDDYDDAVSLDDVVRELQRAPNASKILIFDACRTELQLPVKSSAKAFVAPPQPGGGTLIAFATGPNEVADDTGDVAGPFATALASELQTKRQSYGDLFRKVREQVLARTRGRQNPFQLDGLRTNVMLGVDAAVQGGSLDPTNSMPPDDPCATFGSTMEKLADPSSGPTVTVNVVLLDARPGCRITKVEHTVVRHANFSNYKIAYENGRKLARITFHLLATPARRGFAKIDFKVHQALAP